MILYLIINCIDKDLLLFFGRLLIVWCNVYDYFDGWFVVNICFQVYCLYFLGWIYKVLYLFFILSDCDVVSK